MIYLVGSSKGGAGKSTVAVNLAALLASLRGRDVLLVDTDQAQPSSSLWASLRAARPAAPPLSCVAFGAASLGHEVRRALRKYDDIVLDAGGHDSAELRAALLVADVVLMPVAPALFDIAAMATDSKLLDFARQFNPALRAFIVINNASTHSFESGTRDTREQARQLAPNYAMLDTVLRRRATYDSAKLAGLGVVELGARDKAAELEMRALFNELAMALPEGA